jgi:hypothetical protein
MCRLSIRRQKLLMSADESNEHSVIRNVLECLSYNTTQKPTPQTYSKNTYLPFHPIPTTRDQPLGVDTLT